MAQPTTFLAGEEVLDQTLMQDVNDVSVEDFYGLTFEQLNPSQQNLFEQVIRDLRTTKIEDDPEVDADTNIDRLIQVAEVLRLGMLYGEQKEEKMLKENDEIQKTLAERDEVDPIQLLEEVKRGEKRSKDMNKRIADLERELEERQDEIKSLEDLQREEKKRAQAVKDELQAVEEKLRDRDREHRDLRQETDELRKTQADSYGAEETQSRMQTEKDRLQRRIDSYQKTQKDLQYQLAETNKKFKLLQQENDEDKAKLVDLHDMQAVWKMREAELETKVEDLTEERERLQEEAEELKAEVDEKITLLEEFQVRFNRQFASWEQEREALEAQVAAMEQGHHPVGGTHQSIESLSQSIASQRFTRGGVNESVEALREELNVAREEQVMLMEAYEQLEKDVGKEIDKALDEQTEKIEESESRLKVTEEELHNQNEVVKQLQEQIAELQTRTEEAEEEARKFLDGNYGLSDAVHDTKLMKQKLREEEKALEAKVDEVNKYAAKMEELLEENAWLKRKAGLPEDISIDLGDLKLARQGKMMQLKAMNAMLEEENMRLEEDVRRLKHEMRFRTKWEGLNAAGLGLTPEQMQLLELKAEQIKYGQVDSRDEELLRLQKRIQYLEGRLAEAQAFADLPANMRDFDKDNSDRDSHRRQKPQPQSPGAKQMQESHQRLLAAADDARATLADALGALPSRHVETRNLIQAAIKALEDASLQGRKAAGPGHGLAGLNAQEPMPPTPDRQQSAPAPPVGFQTGTMPFQYTMSDVLADAQAEKLREKLMEMATELAELQGIAAQKNGLLEAAEREKAELARRLRAGGAGLDGQEGGMVSREEFEEMRMEADSLKQQLVECLEEQSLKEREISAMQQDMERYRHRFQAFEDQKRLLYREYVREWKQWKTESDGLKGKVARLKADRDEAKAATEEYKRGLEAIQRGTQEEIRVQYGDAVRRMALASMRSARLARELEASSTSEKALQREKAELEDEISDMGSTLRTRMRYLERGKQSSDKRIERLYRDLEASIPCKAYETLVGKFAALQRQMRRRLEDSAEEIMRDEEVLSLRDEVAELTRQIFEMVEDNAQLREQKRQADRRWRDSAPAGTAISVGTGSLRSSGRQVPQSPRGAGGVSHPEDVAELVKLRVEEGNARKREELSARRVERAGETETELKARLSEVEKQMCDSASELHAAMETNNRYRERIEGGLSGKEAAALREQVEILSTATSEAESALAEWKQKAREMEESAVRDKRSHTLQLATITQLRAALREVSSSGDGQAALAKMHEEINHVRSKEACVRNQLIRSEQERNKLQDENSSLRRELGSKAAAIGRLQENAHFAGRERQELLLQLQVGMQGRVEAWRAERWRRKLDDIKCRNDVLSGDIDHYRCRVLALESRAEKAELELEAVVSLEEILSRPVAEAYRQAAHLTEQSLHQRLETSKLQRELSLQTEKVRYLERVNAELEARLEEYESEAFRNQALLEAEKMDLLNKNRQLEERLMNTASEAEHREDAPSRARASLVGASLVDGHQLQRRRQDRLKFQGHAEEDRQAMLDHVEQTRALKSELSELEVQLKEAKENLTEKEYSHGVLKVEYEDLVAQMARERELRLASDEALSLVERRQQSGSDSAMQQVRAVAEHRIKQLEKRLAERDGDLEASGKRIAEMREQYLLQHDRDREEIERLNQMLFERNENTIANLKNTIHNSRLPQAVEEDEEVRDHGMSYDRLQRLLDQRENELEQIRNQLEQIKTHYEVAASNFHDELRQKDNEVADLKAMLHETQECAADTATLAQKIAQLEREGGEKNVKLTKLKAALRDMEQRMIETEQNMARKALDKATHQEKQSHDDHRLQALDDEKRKVEKELKEVKMELSELRNSAVDHNSQQGAELQKLQEKLDAALRNLTKERKKVRDLKNQRDSTSDLNTTLLKPDPKIAGALENRVKVLEAQNARLRAVVQAERGPMEQEAALEVADEREAARTRRMTERMSQDENDGPGTGGRDPPGSRPGTVRGANSRSGRATDYSGTDPGVKQWEENKKLKDRIQKLRDALAAKTKSSEDVTKERDRRTAQVATLQDDLKRTKDLLAEAQRAAGSKAASGARPTLSEPQKMRELVEEANAVMEERDQLAQKVERLQRQLEVANGAAKATQEEEEEDDPDRQVTMYELRLEKDHAQAQVARLKGQLEDLFHEQASLASRPAARKGTVTKKSSSAREAELETTIDALQRALDRLQREAQQSVPNTKYMALLEKKKQLAKQLAAAQGSAQASEKVYTELRAMEMKCTHLEATNLALRSQLKDTKLSPRAGHPQESEMAARLRAAEASLQAKEQQMQRLQAQVKEQEASRSGDGNVRGLQRQLEELEAENEDLKTELNAFDPAFFEEIEDLKHEHHELSKQAARYERIVRDLSRQLGIPAPIS